MSLLTEDSDNARDGAMLPAPIVLRPDPALVETLVQLATNRVTLPASRRAYERAVRDFLA